MRVDETYKTARLNPYVGHIQLARFSFGAVFFKIIYAIRIWAVEFIHFLWKELSGLWCKINSSRGHLNRVLLSRWAPMALEGGRNEHKQLPSVGCEDTEWRLGTLLANVEVWEYL